MSDSEAIVCPNCGERSPAGYVLCPYCGYSLVKVIQQLERVRIPIRESLERVWRSLYDPRKSKRLFEEISKNPDYKGVLILIYLVGVTYGMRLTAVLMKTPGLTAYADFAPWLYIIMPWFVGIAFFILGLVGWFMVSLIIFIIAKTLDGKAGFKDTMSIVGYSFGPLIPASLIINLLITLIGPSFYTISESTAKNLEPFDLLYIPFIIFAAYHCGNGINLSHLLSKQESFMISIVVAAGYIAIFVLKVMSF